MVSLSAKSKTLKALRSAEEAVADASIQAPFRFRSTTHSAVAIAIFEPPHPFSQTGHDHELSIEMPSVKHNMVFMILTGIIRSQ
jgi:hypothetical protein